MEPDFSGYATKAGLKCSDGRTIKPEAFQHMDKMTVPLVWQHGHNSTENILGHAILESRPDGVYAYGFFNKTKQGQDARELVQHKDINRLSIYANQLVEKSKQVFHGMIREVSLVVAGANPKALIDYVRIQHSADTDDFTDLEDEAIIHTGLEIELPQLAHEDDETDAVVEDDKPSETDAPDTGAEVEHADTEMSVQDVIDSMNEQQRNVLTYFIGAALDQGDGSQAEHTDNEEGLAHQEGNDTMPRNVFEQNAGGQESTKHELSHSDLAHILGQAKKLGSLKDAVLQYADNHLEHGINDIDILFPDAKALDAMPQFNKRRTEWVSSVLGNTRHTLFSRVKTIIADITQDDARAKGYVKGTYKKEEWIGISKRTTGPTTVYKKQQLDRDDMLDITDFDVVVFLKGEMRIMLEEELARAILIGDGRDVSDEDKVKDPIGAAEGTGIRSILNDHEYYVTTLTVDVTSTGTNYENVVDAVIDGMEYYKGTSTPTFFTTIKNLNMFLKAKDNEGRRYYKNRAEVAEALGVAGIVTVEPMNDVTDLIGIVVDLGDYNIGADKGGEVSLFDDFDIDYNTYKYLIETRMSGALTKFKSALVIRKAAVNATQVTPTKPSFNATTGVTTIPSVTGVVYKNEAGSTLSAGAQTALAAGASLVVNAVPSSGSYYFSDTVVDGPWTFTRPAA